LAQNRRSFPVCNQGEETATKKDRATLKNGKKKGEKQAWSSPPKTRTELWNTFAWGKQSTPGELSPRKVKGKKQTSTEKKGKMEFDLYQRALGRGRPPANKRSLES